MSINRVLKKEGIKIVGTLDTLTINTLAKNIANLLSSKFPSLSLNSNDLFINISRLNMYYAELPNGISAKYFYKNRSIYFDRNLDINNLTTVAIHECIHYLQEKRDKNNNIIKLGLCDYTNKNLPGIGINEAAVQLISAKASNLKYENVKYFDINLQTNTPMYYPLECALVNQLAYVVGENVLIDSTIHSNNNFKENFISLTSEENYFTIEKNIDILVETQERLEELFASLENVGLEETFVKKISKEIDYQKAKVKDIFMSTQRLILTSYFDNAIKLAYSPKSLENYRNKLYLFKNLIGYTDHDNFYNKYYIDKMKELEKRYEFDMAEITALTVIKTSFISKLIQKLKALFGLNKKFVSE